MPYPEGLRGSSGSGAVDVSAVGRRACEGDGSEVMKELDPAIVVCFPLTFSKSKFGVIYCESVHLKLGHKPCEDVINMRWARLLRITVILDLLGVIKKVVPPAGYGYFVTGRLHS